MNLNYITIPAIATIINTGVFAETNEKDIDQFLKNQLSIDQLFYCANLDSSNIDVGYDIVVVSQNNNPFGRPNPKSTEVTGNVANILNFMYDGLPLEDKISHSKEVLTRYLNGVIDKDVTNLDSLIQPVFSPNDSSTIIEWAFTGDIKNYLKGLKPGEEPLISNGKILTFNDEIGLQILTKTLRDTSIVKVPRIETHAGVIGYLINLVAPKKVSKVTKITKKENISFERENSINYALNFPFSDVERLFKTFNPDPEIKYRIKPIEVVRHLEVGFNLNYSEQGIVTGVSFPLPFGFRINGGILIPSEQTKILNPVTETIQFLSGNIGTHKETGTKNTNRGEIFFSYPIGLRKWEIEGGAGVAIIRENEHKRIFDIITNSNGFILDQDIDYISKDKLNAKFKVHVGINYNFQKMKVGINSGFIGKDPSIGITGTYKFGKNK